MTSTVASFEKRSATQEPGTRRSKLLSDRARNSGPSEAWDDDFFFQPPSLASSSHGSSSKPSSSPRIDPILRTDASTSASVSATQALKPVGLAHNRPSTLPLASIASSAWTAGSDQDATIQPSTTQATPRASVARTRASTPSTVRASPASKQTPRSRLPVRSAVPPVPPLPRSASQSTVEEHDSTTTPSLTEDSWTNGEDDGDEVATETDGSGAEVAMAMPDVAVWSRTGKSRWNFSRRASQKRSTEAAAMRSHSIDVASPPRSKHSSFTSTSSGQSTDRGNRRISLSLASLRPRDSPAMPVPPTPSSIASWREYAGTTTEDDETTGPDEPVSRPLSRQVSRAHSRPVSLTRPTSPVESILGGDKSRWNSSQVLFASTASAFALRESAGPGADTSNGRKRKLVKKRPDSQSKFEPESLSALGLAPGDEGTSERPLLAPSIFSNSSAGSSQTARLSRIRPAPSTRAQPSRLPTLSTSRTPRPRSVTTPARAAPSGPTAEVDSDWLGAVPFPPSPRQSTDQAPPSPKPTCLVRKNSSTRSRPPVSNSRSQNSLGSAIASFLSRSTSAASLSGKRAPSPAPSAKSAKSSKSMLFRRSSRKLRVDEPDASPVPDTGTVSRRRFSVARPSPAHESVPAVPALPPTAQIPRSGSAFSFLSRSRRLSRAVKPVDAPLSPTKAVPRASPAPRNPSTEGSVRRRPPVTRPLGAKHRPSASLSSIMPLRPVSPMPAVATTPSADFGDVVTGEVGSLRRNSLGDLRIPLRITTAQKKIEEDLERVKQFARAIEELKALRLRFDAVSPILPPADSCWEQAQALVDLGDGKPPRDAASPSLASRQGSIRSRPSPTASRKSTLYGRPRKQSASSIESDFSIAARQRDMLRGVLANANKGASLPVRSAPTPRPALSVLTGRQSDPIVSRPSPKEAPVPFSPSRRASRQTVLGIRDLLARLRSKATAELAASAADPLPQRSVSDSMARLSSLAHAGRRPSAGSGDSDEDWDRELGASQKVALDEIALHGKMALTPEAMPQLIAKAAELRLACEQELARIETA